MQDFSKSIRSWYDKSHRDLPWRNTGNPYFIWLSEVILQQTRVDQGLSYYHRFIENFPSVSDLADADEQAVLKMWQGLGYYSRARNLHTTAKIIRDKYAGKFPSNYVEIRSLKGIGDYTAAAIASFAFALPYPVVDGNVYRVLARVFNITEPVPSNKSKKIFTDLAAELIDKEHPAIHNQAIMELGAIVCTPVNPSCDECPLNYMCLAREKDLVKSLPFKKQKAKPTARYIEYFVHKNKDTLLLRKRSSRDIWENLFDFPAIEFKEQLDPLMVSESEGWKDYFKGKRITIEEVSNSVKHVLSHQVIHARFWKIRHKGKILTENSEYVKLDDLGSYPVPRLIDRYLSENI